MLLAKKKKKKKNLHSQIDVFFFSIVFGQMTMFPQFLQLAFNYYISHVLH